MMIHPIDTIELKKFAINSAICINKDGVSAAQLVADSKKIYAYLTGEDGNKESDIPTLLNEEMK